MAGSGNSVSLWASLIKITDPSLLSLSESANAFSNHSSSCKKFGLRETFLKHQTQGTWWHQITVGDSSQLWTSMPGCFHWGMHWDSCSLLLALVGVLDTSVEEGSLEIKWDLQLCSLPNGSQQDQKTFHDNIPKTSKSLTPKVKCILFVKQQPGWQQKKIRTSGVRWWLRRSCTVPVPLWRLIPVVSPQVDVGLLRVHVATVMRHGHDSSSDHCSSSCHHSPLP